MGSSGRLPTGNRRQPAPQHFAVAFGKLSGASSAPNLQMDEARNMCWSFSGGVKGSLQPGEVSRLDVDENSYIPGRSCHRPLLSFDLVGDLP